MKLKDLAKVAVPLGVVGIVLLLVIPVPAVLLDVLIIVNIMLAMVILLTSMFVRRPLDFSVFPSLLLVATLFRLSLNVASTRLVLGQGYAGQVIEAMGHVVIGGSLVIGLVIFLILVVIQLIVITKGAERVAEVGARFTLDAMPGKQMAIDADLNSGLITEEEARRRRKEVSAEADFYGAMDGASKFVKGDAIAGIVITIINLVGGFVTGMVMRGMGIGEALETYSILTVGDGLVTQIPALLMAVATGMIVTRANAEEDMGSTASSQLGQSSQALMITGAGALFMAFIPGMPKLIFFGIGVVLILFGQRVKTATRRSAAEAEALAALEQAGPPREETTEDIIEEMRVAAVEITLSTDLAIRVREGLDDLIPRVKLLRKNIAHELGVVIPGVRTRDGFDLAPGTYKVLIAGVEVGSGEAPTGMVLAVGGSLDALHGTPTREPVFGMPGKWIPAAMTTSAEVTGAMVVDRMSVIVAQLSAVLKANAARLLSREDVRVLTEGVQKDNPKAVEELTPAPLSLAEIQRVLQGLLAEQVPINDLPRIYEALAIPARNRAPGSSVAAFLETLTEDARGALGAAVARPYVVDGTLRAVMFEPLLEQAMMKGLEPSEHGTQIRMEPARYRKVIDAVAAQVAAVRESGQPAVLICAPMLRPAVRRLVATQDESLPVLSYTEATAGGNTTTVVGVVNDAQAIPA